LIKSNKITYKHLLKHELTTCILGKKMIYFSAVLLLIRIYPCDVNCATTLDIQLFVNTLYTTVA